MAVLVKNGSANLFRRFCGVSSPMGGRGGGGGAPVHHTVTSIGRPWSNRPRQECGQKVVIQPHFPYLPQPLRLPGTRITSFRNRERWHRGEWQNPPWRTART